MARIRLKSLLVARRLKWWLLAASCLMTAVWIGSGGLWVGYISLATIVGISDGAIGMKADLAVGQATAPALRWEVHLKDFDLSQGIEFQWDAKYHILVIPLWLPLVPLLTATFWAWRIARVSLPGHCPDCNYNLSGLDPAAPCPECGVARNA